jgi:ribosomal protein S18 acetylase RimI-like enzyme
MLVRNAFPNDFAEVANKSKEWGDIVIERESIYHILVEHFRETCFIAEDRGQMIGYLLGIRSQSHPEMAYMHLIQVAPKLRGNGVGRRLFTQFQSAAKSMGCTKIYTITKPENKQCIGYYKAMGFNVANSKDKIDVDGVEATKDYNGPGRHMIVWCKEI